MQRGCKGGKRKWKRGEMDGTEEGDGKEEGENGRIEIGEEV